MAGDIISAAQEVIITGEGIGANSCVPDDDGRLPVVAGQSGDWVVGITGIVGVSGSMGLTGTVTAGQTGLWVVGQTGDWVVGITGDVVVVNNVSTPLFVTATSGQVRPYFWHDFDVDGVTPAGTDILFTFPQVQQDVYINTNKAITVKWNDSINTGIILQGGQYDFLNQFAGKVYITTSEDTKLQIYANG